MSTRTTTRPRVRPDFGGLRARPESRFTRPIRTTPSRPVYRSGSPRRLSAPLGWVLLLIVSLGALFWLRTYVFVVKKTGCILNHQPIACSQSLQDIVAGLRGRPLLLANYTRYLEASRSASLDFTAVTYYKLLPDQLVVDFTFPPAAYQISIGAGDYLGFAEDGRYTILPAATESLRLRSYYPALSQRLVNYETDELIHQKLLELEYYSRDQRQNWQEVRLEALNQLRVITAKADYLLDLFDLDADLQELTYLEANRQSERHQEIDLRLSLPVVRPVSRP